MKSELFYRRYPVDAITERHCLSALMLVNEQGHPAYKQLVTRDFYLGASAFNGWLFEKLKAHARRKCLIRFLLLKRNKDEAYGLGEHNLAFAIASLFRARHGLYQGGSIRRLPIYVKRLQAVRNARRRLWVAEQNFVKAWEAWDSEQDEWGQPCDD